MILKKSVQKLCLGTVQMGQKYGVANALGRQPSTQESFAVLRTALEAGISCFDTASIYGTSEELLGDFGLSAKKGVQIISKFPPKMPDDEESVLEEFMKTLHRLKASCVDGYLLHSAGDMLRPGIIRGMQRAKEQGLVRAIGVSVYEPADAYEAVEKRWVDYVQIPYNVLDQRLDETDFFLKAQKYNVKIFARSMFLQGLLLMNPDKVPKNLCEARPWLEKFQSVAEEHSFSRKEAAFLFGLSHQGIDYVVFGVDTKEQLLENLEIVNKLDDFQDCYEKLQGLFRNVDRKLINPSLWR